MPWCCSVKTETADGFHSSTSLNKRLYTTCRGWIDDDMVWEIPRDERPNHVCNPWVWIPDMPISDVAVQIQTVEELMDHLRTIPRCAVLAALVYCWPSCSKL